MQHVFEGRGALKKIPRMMEKLEMTRPMIVGLPPLTDTLRTKVPELADAPVFSAFHANPDLNDALAGVNLFVASQCDGLITIGGGSSIDTGKGIRALLALLAADSSEDTAIPTSSFPDLSALQASSAKSTAILDQAARSALPSCIPFPQIAVPGTAGTGSEATQFAVLYRDGKKLSLSHPALLPAGVILDADLLDTLPLYHKKSCALDALSQGIESYWCAAATDESRVHAFLAILGVLDNLKPYLAGDSHAAEEMLHASCQSGKAIQITRTTAAHAMSYQLTKTMGLAHGHACMVTLPVLWEMMLPIPEMQPLLKDLAEKMRLGDPRMGPKLLRGIMLSLEMSIPPCPPEEQLEALASSVNTERLNNHPVPLSHEEVKEAYRRAFTPLSPNEQKLCRDLWECR